MLEAETRIKQMRRKRKESDLKPFITFLQQLSQELINAKVESINYYNYLELLYKDRWKNDYSKKKK